MNPPPAASTLHLRRFPVLQTLLPVLALTISLTGWRPWSGQAQAQTGTPAEGSTAWVRSEVYFGMSTPGGELIAGDEWQEFVNTEITPRFPAGLSIIDTAGQWRNAGGHIDREPGKLLVLLHPDDAATDSAIEAIRRTYCTRFRQEAVMKVATPASVSF